MIKIWISYASFLSYSPAEIFMELPLLRILSYNQRLFIHWSFGHFEININNNDST